MRLERSTGTRPCSVLQAMERSLDFNASELEVLVIVEWVKE